MLITNVNISRNDKFIAQAVQFTVRESEVMSRVTKLRLNLRQAFGKQFVPRQQVNPSHSNVSIVSKYGLITAVRARHKVKFSHRVTQFKRTAANARS